MNSKTKRDDPVGFGATLGLSEAEAPVGGRNASLRVRIAQAIGEGREPEHDDGEGREPSAPPQRVVAVVAVWGLVLGLGGIVVGVSSLIRIYLGVPWWFGPAIVLLGLVGVGLTVSGFATADRRKTPWLMLLAATATLAGAAALVANT